MKVVRHPLVARDLEGMVAHIVDITDGDFEAAERRLDEVDGMLAQIASNPSSGVRLGGGLEGWCVRHGGRGYRLSIVFKADPDEGVLYIAVVAFGGRDWYGLGETLREFAG